MLSQIISYENIQKNRNQNVSALHMQMSHRLSQVSLQKSGNISSSSGGIRRASAAGGAAVASSSTNTNTDTNTNNKNLKYP